MTTYEVEAIGLKERAKEIVTVLAKEIKTDVARMIFWTIKDGKKNNIRDIYEFKVRIQPDGADDCLTSRGKLRRFLMARLEVADDEVIQIEEVMTKFQEMREFQNEIN